MASKDVNIKIKADSTDAQKGIKKAQSELNKFSKEGINKTTKDIQGLGKSIKGLGLSAIISAEVKILKQYLATIKETAKAYINQLDAENGLAKAAKNNPYINGDGVKRLKEYAKELEKTAAIEDNQSLEVMRQLVASGRTEAEVMQIMAAAADYAAGANLDLATAAKQLNATYSGQAGLLSKQIGDVKTLTAEQLKHGDAVKLVGDKYKGMASELANTDTKLENAKKTFKEVLGEFTQPAYEGWNKFWLAVYNNGTSVIKKLSEAFDNISYKGWAKDQVKSLEKLEKDNQALAKKQGVKTTGVKGLSSGSELAISDFVDSLDAEYIQALDKYLKSKKELTAVEEVLSWEVESQIKINEKLAAQEEEKARKELEAKLAKESAIKTTEDAANASMDAANANQAEIDSVDAKREAYQKLADDMGTYISAIDQVNSAASDLANAIKDSLSDQTSEELTRLSEQYTDGIIDYETYCNEKAKLSKKAAEDEYKIKMWEWTTSLAMATANIAQGVAAALSKEPPASYILAALTASAGAIQLASIVASKPKHFATGGIVPGSRTPYDSVPAMLKPKEMVLNDAQQGNLWNMLNGGGAGGINMPITINNNASDKVKADATMSRNGLIITVNDIVNSQMQKGVYTGSMNIANARAEGVKYL